MDFERVERLARGELAVERLAHVVGTGIRLLHSLQQLELPRARRGCEGIARAGRRAGAQRDRRRAGAHLDAELAQARLERGDEPVHPAPNAAQRRDAGTGVVTLQLQHGPRQRAGPRECAVEAGCRDLDVDVVGSHAVGAARDGSDQSVEHPCPHARAHELAQAVLAADREHGPNAIEVGPPRAARPDHPGHVRDEGIAWNPEHPAHRQRRRAPAGQSRHPGGAGLRHDHLGAEAELVDQLPHDPAPRREALRADVDHVAGDLGRAHRAAQGGGCLDQRHAHPDLGALQRRDHARDAAPDDDDVGLRGERSG